MVEAPLRRFDRISYQPDRYYDFLIWDNDPIELDENNEDPIEEKLGNSMHAVLKILQRNIID